MTVKTKRMKVIVAGPRVAKVLAFNAGQFHTSFVPVVSSHSPKLLGQIARAIIEPGIISQPDKVHVSANELGTIKVVVRRCSKSQHIAYIFKRHK